MNGRLFNLARLLSVVGLALTVTPPPEPRPVLAPPVWAARTSAPDNVAPLTPGYHESPVDTPSFEDEFMMLVNQARWDNGALPPLKRVDLLDISSETHSDNMAAREFFAHCDPDTGTLPWDRMQAAGYNWNSAAENIAAGPSPTPTPTRTPSPSPSATYTATPGPSPTPTLTATPFFWTDRLFLPVVRR